jgi:regulator of protease activity HflC (stomatin/prohibitin superfamily)
MELTNMRFLEKCPQCGFQEQVNWRPSMMSIEQDITEAENIPELATRLVLKKMDKKEPVIVDGTWAYKLTRPGRYVVRVPIAIYKANGNSFKRAAKTGNNSVRAKQLASMNANMGKHND